MPPVQIPSSSQITSSLPHFTPSTQVSSLPDLSRELCVHSSALGRKSVLSRLESKQLCCRA